MTRSMASRVNGYPTHTTNKTARPYVQKQTPFQGSNVFGEFMNDMYTVYSYGYHFPLFIYDKQHDRWLENDDSYSQTTTRHKSLLRPTPNTIKCTIEQMQAVIRAGSITGIIQDPN